MKNSNKIVKTDMDLPVETNSSDPFMALGKFFEFAREDSITKRKIEEYRTKREIIITKIITECELKRQYMELTFAERRKVIEECFKRIDKGIENNDHQLIAMGFQLVDNVVKNNPFQQILTATPIQRREMLENFSLDQL